LSCAAAVAAHAAAAAALAQVATVLRLRLVAKPNKLPPGGYRPAPVQEILAKLRRS
jgi:hypothetical protein